MANKNSSNKKTINQNTDDAKAILTSKIQANHSVLRETVKQTVKNFLYQLKGQEIIDFYDLVLCEVEHPMLDQVMQYCRGNQTKASKLLGINRGTLRKKLKKYDLD